MSAPPKQRWLILAHAFNMDGRAASQTITDKIPHLLNAGIEIVVLSGALGEQDSRFEHHRLWPWGPAGIRFELRHVLRQHLSGWAYRVCMVLLSLPLLPFMLIEKALFRYESSWSWRFAARHKGRALAKAKPFDLIYSTGGAYAAHWAGCDLHLALGTPWLAEVHDPFLMPGKTAKTAHERKKLDVERMICSHADLAIWFTQQAMLSAERRQPQLKGRGMVILPGIDQPFPSGLPPYKAGPKMVLGHFGSLSSTRTLVRFIDAIEKWIERVPEVASQVELHVTGGPLDAVTQARLDGSPVRSIFRHLGRIEADPISGLSGRACILQKMRSTDVLLLVHGEEPICEEYIPSKLYEYLWMQRPILAQVHCNAQMKKMLIDLGHVAIETERASDDQVRAGLVLGLQQLYSRWCSPGGLVDNGLESPFTTGNAVRQILERLEGGQS